MRVRRGETTRRDPPPGWRLAIAIAAGMSSREASAQTASERTSVFYRARIGGQVNGLGGAIDAALGVRWRLAWAAQRPLVSTAAFSLVTTMNLTPVFVRPGVALELQPLDVLQLFVGWEALASFGILGSITSYDRPSQNFFGDAFVPASQVYTDNAGGAYATTGSIVTFGATLQFGFGPVVARSALRVSRYDMALQDRNREIPDAGRDRYFVDPLYGTLVENHGWLARVDTDLGARIGTHVTAALRHSYACSPYVDPDPEQSGLMHRVGPVLAYTMFTRPGARVEAPTLFLAVQWYAVHRFRAGQEIPTAVPYAGIALAIRGDLY